MIYGKSFGLSSLISPLSSLLQALGMNSLVTLKKSFQLSSFALSFFEVAPPAFLVALGSGFSTSSFSSYYDPLQDPSCFEQGF